MSRKDVLLALTAFIGILFACPDCPAQGVGRKKSKSKNRFHERPHQIKNQIPEALRDSIVVLPEKITFDTLQGVFDYCNGQYRSGRSEGRGYISIPAGTYFGNWVIPPGYSVYGSGAGYTILIGKQGVSAPTIKYPAPSGPSDYSFISELTVVGREVAAVEYTGNQSQSSFGLGMCELETMATNPIPALKISGEGAGYDQCMEFWTYTYDDSPISIYSSTGNAIEATLGSDVELEFERCEIEAAQVGLVISSPGATDSYVDFEKCYFEDCQYGIKATDTTGLDLRETEIEVTVDAIEISGSIASIYRCEFYAPGIGVNASSGSSLYIAYTGFFDCQQAISVDASSTKRAAFNHLDFIEL